jgi:hypothetical protein
VLADKLDPGRAAPDTVALTSCQAALDRFRHPQYHTGACTALIYLNQHSANMNVTR